MLGYENDKIIDQLDLKIGNWIDDAFYPKPSGLIKYYFNTDDVLTIEVLGGVKKPYYLKEKGIKPSGVYLRVGRSKRKTTEPTFLS